MIKPSLLEYSWIFFFNLSFLGIFKCVREILQLSLPIDPPVAHLKTHRKKVVQTHRRVLYCFVSFFFFFLLMGGRGGGSSAPMILQLVRIKPANHTSCHKWTDPAPVLKGVSTSNWLLIILTLPGDLVVCGS